MIWCSYQCWEKKKIKKNKLSITTSLRIWLVYHVPIYTPCSFWKQNNASFNTYDLQISYFPRMDMVEVWGCGPCVFPHVFPSLLCSVPDWSCHWWCYAEGWLLQLRSPHCLPTCKQLFSSMSLSLEHLQTEYSRQILTSSLHVCMNFNMIHIGWH